MSDNGYSLGSVCETCISKAKHNAEITNQKFEIEELHDDNYNTCVYCGKELISKRGIQLKEYRKKADEMAKQIEELYKSKKITKTEFFSQMKTPILLERAINCELSGESYLDAYRKTRMMYNLNKMSTEFLF